MASMELQPCYGLCGALGLDAALAAAHTDAASPELQSTLALVLDTALGIHGTRHHLHGDCA